MKKRQLNMLLNPYRLRLQNEQQKYLTKGVRLMRKKQLKIFKPDLLNYILNITKQNKTNLGESKMYGKRLLTRLTWLLNPSKLTSDINCEYEKGGECKMNKTVLRKLNKAAIAIFAFATIFAFNAVNVNAEAPAENSSSQIIVSTEVPD